MCAAAALGAIGCEQPAPRLEKRATDELARVAQIEAAMPGIRRLSLDRPIPASRQTAGDFRAALHRELAGAKGLEHHATALRALGLIDATTDLTRSMEDVYASQLAAYYSPQAKRFTLVTAPKDPLMFDSVVAHELAHGLQDQHFDLATFIAGTKDAPLSADEQLARKFIVEGDATFTSVVFIAYSKTHQKELTGAQVSAARRELDKLARLDGAGMGRALAQQLTSAKIDDPELRRAIDAMPGLPPAILEPVLAPYMKGAALVAAAYDRGEGWYAVDKLFADPPASTEQALHPGERFFVDRDPPRKIVLPTFDEELLESDVLGELMWSVYFRRWKHTGDAHPEQGWGGDRYGVWKAEDGTIIAGISTRWDSEADAKEFYDAYLSTLAVRYPDRAPGRGEEVRAHTWVRLVGDRVLIVDGADYNPLDAFADP